MQKSTLRMPYASDEAGGVELWKPYKKAG